jgi:hypothetical protein
MYLIKAATWTLGKVAKAVKSTLPLIKEDKSVKGALQNDQKDRNGKSQGGSMKHD